MKKSNVFQKSTRLCQSTLVLFSFLFLFSCDTHRKEERAYSTENAYYLEDYEAITEEMPPAPPSSNEEYDRIFENQFFDPRHQPLSTFSIDVDNASYSNVRRFLNEGQWPPRDAVRIEEMVNYFTYDYPQPTDGQPFAVASEVGPCPWNQAHKLVHIGLQGRSIDRHALMPSNLVFLVDVSGSMSDNNKLPLLKRSLTMLLNELGPQDRVAIVAYAGAAGLVLPSTPANHRNTILNALNRLDAGGSTAGGEGIQLAYEVALQNRIEGGNNRVILATDGDFNVGVSSTDALVQVIEQKRRQDIYLTLCGFGMGNYKDGRMEQISNAGNGNYFYIDNEREAQKVFVTEMRANMFTIAKDVKIQVEFNPKHVKAYRLIGYENRMLKSEDFNNDAKDAGELGAGHTVTALYEIIPQGTEAKQPNIDPLRYQKNRTRHSGTQSELMTVKLRYKPIHSEVSNRLVHTIYSGNESYPSDNFRFSSAVAGFGLLLRKSEHNLHLNLDGVTILANSARGADLNGHRAEFLELVNSAKRIENVY